MATAPTSATRPTMPFVPNSHAAVLTSKHALPTARPVTVGPIFDPDGLEKPVKLWSRETHESNYPPNTEPYAPARVPTRRPSCYSERYLRATLAKNERLRLSMLWYYTRDILNETEFLSGLQEKAHLAREAADWEFSVIGFLDVNHYTRLAAVGLPLGILPRGETICAHTVTQPPGNVFLMPNMLEDWRFKDCPYVESGKLHAYAGAPLRLQSETGETVGFGSLCVASGTRQEPLTKTQQRAIAHLADWIISDLVQCARVRRQRVRRQMSDLIAIAQAEMDHVMGEEPVLNILRVIYPEATISLKSDKATHLEVEGRDSLPLVELEDGVWEDTDYIDEFIAESNCFEPPTDRVVRVLTAKFESTSGPSLLAVASNDFRLVFDDIDLWFVQTCASIVSQAWHKRLLNEAIKAKEEFLRGFSHQLRTPIHGILGCVELLAEELIARNTIAEAASAMVSASDSGTPYVYLDTIKSSGRDLISIVNSMITLNRWVEIAVAERSCTRYSLLQLEDDLAQETKKTFSGDNRYQSAVFFRCNPSTDCGDFQIDDTVLRDSLLPLIVNAIHNTPGGIVTVTMALRSDSRELVVDVEDTGYGIDSEHHERIFEPYQKVGEHSTGAGLGLTIASKFAALLKGSVTLVSSNVGRGSHFRATYKELECAPPTSPVQSLASTFNFLPSQFHYMPLASDKVSPCDHLTTSLTRHGFTSSDRMDNHAFVLVDYVSDPTQRSQYLSQIPPNRIAVCLSPPSGEETSRGEAPKNLVCIHGPFCTSTISTALAEADKLLMEMASRPEPAISSPPLPSDESLSIDEVVASLSNTTLAATNSVQPTEAKPVDPITNSKCDQTPTPNLLSSTAEPSPTSSTLTTSKPTVLVVDDNIINLRFLQMYCKKRKLAYISAKDGKQAVDLFLQHQQQAAAGHGAAIQLILMDLQMPVCDGLEATKQIRSSEKEHDWKQSTLFIVTGQDTPSDRAASKDAGADGYIAKPVTLKLLDGRIREVFPDFVGG